MKLNTAQAKRVEDEFGVATIPDDHPLYPKLVEAFGDHTFVLDSGGLNIVEPDASPDAASGTVVRLATWSEDKSSLNVHEPQVLSVKVNLEADK